MGFSSRDVLHGVFAVVVDRDKERRQLVTGLLRYCGALVSPAETPDGAFAIMRLLKPDVIVVDWSSPNDDALAFIRGVRALDAEDGGMVPAIAIGEGSDGTDLARASGVDMYLTRPLQTARLCEAINELLT